MYPPPRAELAEFLKAEGPKSYKDLSQDQLLDLLNKAIYTYSPTVLHHQPPKRSDGDVNGQILAKTSGGWQVRNWNDHRSLVWTHTPSWVPQPLTEAEKVADKLRAEALKMGISDTADIMHRAATLLEGLS